MAATIEVHFTHPATATSLTTDVSPQCTAQEAINELLSTDEQGSLLPIPSSGTRYHLMLRKTEALIAPSMTFEEAGVEDGDTVDVLLEAQGGGPDWAELGHMLFWSMAAASIFIKAAKPILIEFLKNKRSRSIIVRTGKSEIALKGEDPEKVMEILKLIENKSINTLAGDASNSLQDSTIEFILRDSEGRDSSE
jgi:hypothetical protein